MNRRDRELIRLLSAIAEETNARLLEVQKTNGSQGGPPFTGSTSSDYPSIKNFAQGLGVLR
jgi:hypothetical protein